MQSFGDFTARYKALSNSELIKILDNSQDYQEQAVKAARNELSERQLTEAQKTEAKESLKAFSKPGELAATKVKEIQSRVKDGVMAIIEDVNPVQRELPSTEKRLRLIVIVFGGLFIYDLIKNFRMHIAFLQDFAIAPFSTTLYFLPIVTLPIALYLFWRRLRIGWYLLTIYITFSATFILWTLIQLFLLEPGGLSIFDSIMYGSGTIQMIIYFGFFIGTLTLVCKQIIRNVFTITENNMLSTITLTITFSFFAAYSIT